MPAVDDPAPQAMEEGRVRLAIAEAIKIASWGCGIVEVHPPIGDGSEGDGKRPIGAEWQKRATRSPHTIEQIVGRHGQYGVIPWPGERVLILDVDHRDRLPMQLPAGYRVVRGTERGHAYYRLPLGFDPRALPATAGFGEIRVEGASRHVVGPYSRHSSGDVYLPHGDELTEIPARILEELFPVPEPVANGEYAIPAGYQLPDFGYVGSRYDAIRDFVASRYMKGLGTDEIWIGVLHLLAPRFNDSLTDAELRSRFDRAWRGTPEKLGPPGVLATPSKPRTAAEVAASSIDAADLLALDIPELQWIVPRLLPEGTTVLAGPPKLGKSCLVYQIAVEVALGGELLGRDISQGDVLYLALEDGKRRGQTRLRAALGERAMPRGRLEVRWSAARIGEGLEEELTAWLDAHPDARLVAVDTLQKARARSDARRNAYEVDVEDLGRLQNLFRDRPIGLLIVHHSKKDAGDDFLASVSGTYGITGSADTTLVIQRKRLEAFGKLVVTGRDVQEIEEPVQFNGMLWQSAPRSIAEASFERAEVYKVIETHGPIFPAAIAERIGATREAVRNLVTKMVATGSIARGIGGYVVVATPTIEEEPEEPIASQAASDGSSGSSDSRARARAGGPSASGSSSSYGEVVEEREAPGTRTTRARPPAREAPSLTIVIEGEETKPMSAYCHFPAEHRFRLRDVQTANPWCEICTPKEPA